MKNELPIHLYDPDELSLENAFRTLSKTGEISLETSISRLSNHLALLEQKGFACMEIQPFSSVEEKITIRACKGKQGTCYNTGRTARYLGTALAALDDDHHLLLAGKEMPICEKTATLYSSQGYKNHIDCSGADPELLEKLQTDPQLFDCDNFESYQEELYARVESYKHRDEFKDLFYPGPFKLLVLNDGTIVHRGIINKVPEQEARKLIKFDGFFHFDGQESIPCDSFQERYRSEGPRCLLNLPEAGAIDIHEDLADFSTLKNISKELRIRLLDTIDKNKDYFILTGSNREDEYGCCPSDEVTLADHLVRKGILSASRESVAAEVCPITIYAFRKEISSRDGSLHFNQDQDFREELKNRLNNTKTVLFKLIARWTLTLFVALSLLLALIRITGPSSSLQNNDIFTRLEVNEPNSTVLILFHYSKRCEQCRAMEKYSKEVLSDNFPDLMQDQQLLFRQVVMDRPENRDLIESFGLVTSTLAIISFQGMEQDSIRVLDSSWALYDQEKEFKKMLSDELHRMTDHLR